MNIDTLNMFCLVVEEGSISKAARLSFVSQPAVSNQIQLLEKHYGIALFDRTGGKLTPTEAGLTLYPYAKEIIDYFKRSKDAVDYVSKGYKSSLNIGASLTIGEYLLPGILGEFQKKNNKINFSLYIGNTPNIIAKLEKHEIDLALVEGIVTSKNLKLNKIGQDHLILIVPSNHHWANRNEIEIEELAGERLILREENSGARRIIENLLSEKNVLNKISDTLELGSTQSIKSAVEAGLGVSIVPKLSVQRELELGVLKHIPIAGITITRDLWLVERHTRFPKTSNREFISFLKNRELKIY